MECVNLVICKKYSLLKNVAFIRGYFTCDVHAVGAYIHSLNASYVYVYTYRFYR